MKIYLVRHGKKEQEITLNDDGYPDMELTELGKLQAEKTGLWLSNIKFDAVYASDLKRTVQTAMGITEHQHNDLDIMVDTRIKEINMGVFHYMSPIEVEKKHPEFYSVFKKRDTDFTYLEGESGADVTHRVINFLNDVVKQSYENVCVATHGGVIRSIVSHFIGLDQKDRFKIVPYNCGITVIEYQRDSVQFRVCSVNEGLHLRDMLTT